MRSDFIDSNKITLTPKHKPQYRQQSSSVHTLTANVAQLVEHDLAKVGVASSNLVIRSMRRAVAHLVCGLRLLSDHVRYGTLSGVEGRPDGGIGRHAGLKILFPLRECGFDSRSGYESSVSFPGLFLWCIFFYIIYNERHDRYYIGQTNNLDSRVKRHNSGQVRSTKAYLPWVLVYKEIFESRSLAVRREKYLKSLKSKVKLQELINTSR